MAASARETELAMQLRQADEAVLQITKELREAKRAAAGTPDSDGSDGGGRKIIRFYNFKCFTI